MHRLPRLPGRLQAVERTAGLRTRNFGSYQNPPDLQWNTWTLIRFQEHVDQKGNLKWLFRKDGCMHCTDAACVKVCPSGALYHTDSAPSA